MTGDEVMSTTPSGSASIDVHFGQKWYYESKEECLKGLGDRAYGPPGGGVYCNGTYDLVLCWPATPAYTTVKQHCPPLQGLDPSKYGFRKCGANGLWEGKVPGDYSTNPNGWTNYTDCYTPETRKIYEDMIGDGESLEVELLKQVARGARIIEFIGLSVSLLSLLLSIFIFCYFRGLRCHRTRIHRNLFSAISIHICIQLIVNVDELISKSTGSAVAGTTVTHAGMINNTPILCEILRRVVIEYTKTVMFMWMFIEGMYLHNTLVISVFSGKPNYVLYYCLGWGFPVILTLAWSIPTGLLDKQSCWFGYTFRPLYWIIEGPRAAIILVNLGFLLNIIRVLVTKLRDSNSNEALRVRKAVKAAIVLLPLLGVNNSLSLVEAPTDDPIAFGVFQILFVFLISFQGFFIALLYCFLNGEVKQTISKQWERYLMKKQYAPGHSRIDRTESVFYSITEAFKKEKQPNPYDKESIHSNRWDSKDSGYHGIKPESVNLMNGHKPSGINGSVENNTDDCSF